MNVLSKTNDHFLGSLLHHPVNPGQSGKHSSSADYSSPIARQLYRYSSPNLVPRVLARSPPCGSRASTLVLHGHVIHGDKLFRGWVCDFKHFCHLRTFWCAKISFYREYICPRVTAFSRKFRWTGIMQSVDELGSMSRNDTSFHGWNDKSRSVGKVSISSFTIFPQKEKYIARSLRQRQFTYLLFCQFLFQFGGERSECR